MIKFLLEKLIEFIPVINNIANKEHELVDNALQSVSIALNKTCIYQRDYSRTHARNQDVEAQLSHYWAAAAIPIRHIDKELSEICEYKSEYWSNPENWDIENADGISIDLESVRNKYRNRLSRHRRKLKV